MQGIRIETAQDLIDAIAQHPQFREEVLRHLLTQELLELPAKFEQFRDENNRRLDKLEAGQAELREGQTELREGYAELREGQTELREGYAELREGYAELREGQADLRDKYEELRTGQIELRTGYEELREGQTGLRADVETLKSNVADLRGKDYERSIRYRVRERAIFAFGLISPHIALSQNDPSSPELGSAINRARSRNEISPREIESLLDTDIIVSDEQNSHVAVEASITADDRDITRVRERADILSRITGGTVHAAVAAQTIPDEQHRKAIGLNVTIMQLEYRG